MMDEAVDGAFKGLYVQGEDIAQSDPDTQHITAGLKAMECVIVQDLFLNETARYAHVFLPGSSFLEKDGTFINAERRIGRVRKAIEPLAGKADWQATMLLAEALGAPMRYNHPSEIMDEIAALTPTFAGVSYAKLDELGSVQWPCNDKAPEGTPIMHVDRFVRGKGQFMLTDYVPTEERTGPRFPLLLTTGRILSQYNVGAQTRRTENSRWHEEDVLEIHPFDAESRGINDGDLVSLQSRVGDIALRARVSERMQPGVVYTTFHHPQIGANVVTTDYLRLGDQLPGIQGDGGAGAGGRTITPTGRSATAKTPPRNAASLERSPMPRNERPTAVPRLARTFLYDRGAVGAAELRSVAVETAVEIAFGGAPFAVMMASPSDLRRFCLRFCADRSGDRALRHRVRRGDLRQRQRAAERDAQGVGAERLSSRRRALAGRTGCGVCGLEDLAQLSAFATPRSGQAQGRAAGHRRGAEVSSTPHSRSTL